MTSRKARATPPASARSDQKPTFWVGVGSPFQCGDSSVWDRVRTCSSAA